MQKLALTLIFSYYFFKCHVYFLHFLIAPRVVEDEYDEDGVRAPIPQKQETLIQPGKLSCFIFFQPLVSFLNFIFVSQISHYQKMF